MNTYIFSHTYTTEITQTDEVECQAETYFKAIRRMRASVENPSSIRYERKKEGVFPKIDLGSICYRNDPVCKD